MIRKRLLVTGLAMSMCLNQMPPTVLVKASQNTNSNSKFEVEVKNSKASKYGYIKPAGQSYATNPKSKLKKAAQLLKILQKLWLIQYPLTFPCSRVFQPSY